MTQRTRVLGNRYEIDALVGRGGMAEVFRATDRVLGRTVAVKVLADRFAADQRFVARFRREAQAAAGLNHPNVVSVFDTGSDDGDHYIVMEYVKGETLGELLAREGPLPPERAAEIAGATSAALGAAHAKGLVHRDVKPGNIMLTDDGAVKVMDFGIARAVSDDTLTQTGMIMGTASYLSPEQAQGHAVDARSDVYSLGCVLYEMLAGRPPFTGDGPVAIAYKHVGEEPVPPSELNPQIPAALEEVTMRALSKDPDARFDSGHALHEALTQAVGPAAAAATEPVAMGGDTAVLPETEPAPVPPAERRGRGWLPWVIAAALVAVLVALALLAFPEPTGRRQQPASPQEEPTAPPEEQFPAPPDLGGAGSVQEAVDALKGFFGQGLDAGVFSERAFNDILRPIEDALNHYFAGEGEEALASISEADARTDQLLTQGEIASDEWAGELHEGLDALAEAMQAAPIAPPDEEDEGEGGEGPGPSDGRGRGEGRGKGKNGD